MVDRLWLSRIPATLQSSPDPIETNPFPENHPKHAVWKEATRRATEKLHRFNSNLSGGDGTFSGFANFVLQSVTGKFDIWAERYVHVVWCDADIRAYDEWLFNFAQAWLDLLEKRAEMHSAVVADLKFHLIQRMEYWKAEARSYVAKQNSPQESPSRPPLKSWGELEIRFLSDERVQIFRNGAIAETMNYSEMGFEDKRNGTPKKSWQTFRQLAENRGILRGSDPQWSKTEKRIEEIREILKPCFGLSDDPLPYNSMGYRAVFAISTAPSYRS